uniref:Serpin domain-containing protein n=1 Tax=Panagrolaimus davidi TaxID=227884 RepID=A0A914P573_9BILA
MQADFALEVLRQSHKKNELKSLVISPLLLSIDLAIIYNGATGETAKQIANVITGENSCLKLNKYFVHIWRQLRNQKSFFTTFNLMYVKKNIGVYEQFLNIAEKYFDREVKSVDFSDPDKAAKEINDSIKTETTDLFPEFVQQNYLTTDIFLTLINMIDFRGEFAIHFRPLGPYSIPDEFYVKKGEIRYAKYGAEIRLSL